MATATYVPIATQTLSGSTNTVTFSSIPSGYTDLKLVSSGGSGAVGQSLLINFNGDSGANYSFTMMYVNGTSAGSIVSINQGSINISGYFGLLHSPMTFLMDVFSYTGSTYKTILTQFFDDNNGGGQDSVAATVGLWKSSSAITSLTINSNGLFAGTTFTLWGI